MDDKVKAQVEELGKIYEDKPMVWGKVFFGNHFRKPSPGFHQKILNLALKERYLAVAAPRESAKSTILLFLYAAHRIIFKKKHFVLIVSNTFRKAADSLETIKNEIRVNNRLKKWYKISIKKDSFGDSVFESSDGFTTRVLCFGAEQLGSVRGVKFGAYRPDLILVDDLEDDEMVRNPERRLILRKDFDEALIPAGEHGVTQYIVIGTVLHDDALMARLVGKEFYPEFRKLLYKGRIEKDGTKYSLWNDWRTVAELDAMEREKPDVFAKEIQNDPVSGEMGQFKKEDFRYWVKENDRYMLYDDTNRVVSSGYLKDCAAGIACDLAWEEGKFADFSVILPGYLTPTSDILVEDYICKRGLRPNEIEEILFSMEERLRSITGGSVYIGFEKAKLEKVMRFLLKQAMRKRNHYLLFKDLQWDTDKIQRIVTKLQPRYSQHTIFHKRNMGELEQQLVRIPSGTHDDLPDALQGLVQVLQQPKGRRKESPVDNEFEWWRKKAIEARSPSKGKYAFGMKGRDTSPIKATVSYK